MMGCLAQRRALSSRALQLSFAFACVATLLLGSTTNAGTVLQFAQSNPLDVITATNSGSGTTSFSTAGNADGGFTSVPVLTSNYLGVPFPLGLPMFETFVGVTSTAAATTAGTTITQTYSGTIEFTSLPGGLGALYLSATFGPTGVLSGGVGGGSASLNASVPSDTVTFTVPGMAFTNAALSIAFSGITPTLGTGGTPSSVSSFTAQNSGTFSATTAIPEPGSLCLASCAVVVGALAYGRKKMKNQD